MGPYLDEYRCEDCNRNYWCLANPLSCPSCGGRTKLFQQGKSQQTDVPSVMWDKRLRPTIDWEKFDEWREGSDETQG